MAKYINADALLDKIERMWNAHQLTNTKYKTFVDLLKAEPAADVRENVRGEWVLISKETSRIKYYSCSKCGRHVEVNSELPAYLYFPFCHCGADMRGEE